MKRPFLRWALRLGPREWRREFGPEIEADFEEGWREARDRGRSKAFFFTVGTAWDVGRNGLAERWERRGGRKRRRGTLMLLTQSTIGQDAKVAWRGLYRSPAFTAVAVLALALGIGANTAIFSVVNAVLLSPLPYERSSDLVRIWSSWTQFPRGSVSEPEYYDYKESDSIEALAAFTFPHDATLAVEAVSLSR